MRQPELTNRRSDRPPVDRNRVDPLWLHLAPVILLGAYGTWWIALHGSARGGWVHPLFQLLALTENLVALLMRRRKPMATLVGILAVYLAVDLDAILLPPLLLALLTVVERSDRHRIVAATALAGVVVLGLPLVHGDPTDVAAYGVAHLTAVGTAVILGLNLRSRRTATASPV